MQFCEEISKEKKIIHLKLQDQTNTWNCFFILKTSFHYLYRWFCCPFLFFYILFLSVHIMQVQQLREIVLFMFGVWGFFLSVCE